MERKRKIKRASILAVFIYVMINGFVWGFMKAYLNSYNIISKDQLVMAEVNNNNSKTEIKILNKKFYFDKNKSLQNTAGFLLYIILPDKIKTTAEIVMQCEHFDFPENSQNYILHLYEIYLNRLYKSIELILYV